MGNVLSFGSFYFALCFQTILGREKRLVVEREPKEAKGPEKVA